jgi:MULE transposase domain
VKQRTQNHRETPSGVFLSVKRRSAGGKRAPQHTADPFVSLCTVDRSTQCLLVCFLEREDATMASTLVLARFSHGSQDSAWSVSLPDGAVTYVGAAQLGHEHTVLLPFQGVPDTICSIVRMFDRTTLYLPSPPLAEGNSARHGGVGIGANEAVVLKDGSDVWIGEVRMQFTFVDQDFQGTGMYKMPAPLDRDADSEMEDAPPHVASLTSTNTNTPDPLSTVVDRSLIKDNATDGKPHPTATKDDAGKLPPTTTAVPIRGSTSRGAVGRGSTPSPKVWTPFGTPNHDLYEVYRQLDRLPAELAATGGLRPAKGYQAIPNDGTSTLANGKLKSIQRVGPGPLRAKNPNGRIATLRYTCKCDVSGCKAAHVAHGGSRCSLEVQVAFYMQEQVVGGVPVDSVLAVIETKGDMHRFAHDYTKKHEVKPGKALLAAYRKQGGRKPHAFLSRVGDAANTAVRNNAIVAPLPVWDDQRRDELSQHQRLFFARVQPSKNKLRNRGRVAKPTNGATDFLAEVEKTRAAGQLLCYNPGGGQVTEASTLEDHAHNSVSLKAPGNVTINDDDVIFADGTFGASKDKVPVFNLIKMSEDGTGQPLFSAVYNSEGGDQFEHFLREVTAHLSTPGKPFRGPIAVMIDKSTPLAKAIRALVADGTWPDTKIIICLWHANQAITRKCQHVFGRGDSMRYTISVLLSIFHQVQFARDAAEFETLKDMLLIPERLLDALKSRGQVIGERDATTMCDYFKGHWFSATWLRSWPLIYIGKFVVPANKFTNMLSESSMKGIQAALGAKKKLSELVSGMRNWLSNESRGDKDIRTTTPLDVESDKDENASRVLYAAGCVSEVDDDDPSPPQRTFQVLRDRKSPGGETVTLRSKQLRCECQSCRILKYKGRCKHIRAVEKWIVHGLPTIAIVGQFLGESYKSAFVVQEPTGMLEQLASGHVPARDLAPGLSRNMKAYKRGLPAFREAHAICVKVQPAYLESLCAQQGFLTDVDIGTVEVTLRNAYTKNRIAVRLSHRERHSYKDVFVSLRDITGFTDAKGTPMDDSMWDGMFESDAQSTAALSSDAPDNPKQGLVNVVNEVPVIDTLPASSTGQIALDKAPANETPTGAGRKRSLPQSPTFNKQARVDTTVPEFTPKSPLALKGTAYNGLRWGFPAPNGDVLNTCSADTSFELHRACLLQMPKEFARANATCPKFVALMCALRSGDGNNKHLPEFATFCNLRFNTIENCKGADPGALRMGDVFGSVTEFFTSYCEQNTRLFPPLAVRLSVQCGSRDCSRSGTTVERVMNTPGTPKTSLVDWFDAQMLIEGVCGHQVAQYDGFVTAADAVAAGVVTEAAAANIVILDEMPPRHVSQGLSGDTTTFFVTDKPDLATGERIPALACAHIRTRRGLLHAWPPVMCFPLDKSAGGVDLEPLVELSANVVKTQQVETQEYILVGWSDTSRGHSTGVIRVDRHLGDQLHEDRPLEDGYYEYDDMQSNTPCHRREAHLGLDVPGAVATLTQPRRHAEDTYVFYARKDVCTVKSARKR